MDDVEDGFIDEYAVSNVHGDDDLPSSLIVELDEMLIVSSFGILFLDLSLEGKGNIIRHQSNDQMTIS